VGPPVTGFVQSMRFSHALAAQTVNVRGLQRTHPVVVGGHRIEAHVIGEDEDDVRLAGWRRGGREAAGERGNKDRTDEKRFGSHGLFRV